LRAVRGVDRFPRVPFQRETEEAADARFVIDDKNARARLA
jgi:hypothetical protein